MRVLNVRRLASIARERLIASIPSINPVGGAIAAGFGWRTNPWPEFHKGVDLEANYGDVVRAAAAGTVVSAGWDPGGFGIKVDIDHGNGYHTWYAHLSRVARRAGPARDEGAADRVRRLDRRVDRAAPALSGDARRQRDRPGAVPDGRAAERARDTSRARRAYNDRGMCQIWDIVDIVFKLYILVMIVYAVVSWVPSLRGRWTDYVAMLVEPVLTPVRRDHPADRRPRPLVPRRHHRDPARRLEHRGAAEAALLASY